MRKDLLLTPLAWAVVLTVAGVEVGDYAIRGVRHGVEWILPRHGLDRFALISTSLRTLAALSIAVALLTRAKGRAHISGGALVFALYAGVAAFAVMGPNYPPTRSLRLFDAALPVLLNIASIMYFQHQPAPVARLPLGRVLRFFLHPIPLVLLCSIPLLTKPLPGVRAPIVAVWAISVMALQLAYLRANVRANPEFRSRIFWVAEGLLLLLLVSILQPILSWGVQLFAPAMSPTLLLWLVGEAGHIGAVVCFGIAVFFHDAADAGLVVKRTFAGGLASTASLVVFIAFETILSEAFATLLKAETRAASILAGILAALAFKPVESAAQRWFSRLSAKPAMVDLPTTPAITTLGPDG